MTRVCGGCKWAKRIPQDVRLRQCMGGPPQAIVIQGPQGVMIQTVFPNVSADQEAPACHEEGVYGLDDLVVTNDLVIEHDNNSK